MSTGSTIVGSIGGTSREIVDVISLDTSGGVEWYNIRYKTPTGYKNGFIQKSNIYIPPFVDTNNNRLTKPISSGTYTQDYGVGTNPVHAGVDIAGDGIPVYSIAPGSMEYKAAYDLEYIGGSWKMKFRSYGRHAYWNTTVKIPLTGQTYSLRVVYAHLGSYSNNAFATVSTPDGPKTFSLRYDNSELLTQAGSSNPLIADADFDSIGSGIKVKSNLGAGYTIGTTGNTGNSYAPHLHFEVKSASSGNYDPFNYVLFPAADYDH